MSQAEHSGLNPSGVNAIPPTMSVQETLNGIYTEPGRVFESLRERPRFLVAALLVMAMGPAFQIALTLTYGYNNLMRALFSGANMGISPEARERAIEQYTGPQGGVFLGMQIVGWIVGLVIVFAIGSALYYLAAKLMRPETMYAQVLAVWAYSSLPPAAIASLLNVALLFLRPPRSEAVAAEALRQGGLVQMYLSSFFVDTAAHPVLATALRSFDPLTLYGIYLAGFGLHKVARLSAAQAQVVVLTFWLLALLLRVLTTSLLTAAH